MNIVDPFPSIGDPSLPHGEEVLRTLEKKAPAARQWVSETLEQLLGGR